MIARTSACVIALFTAIASVSAQAQTYGCKVAPPRALHAETDPVELRVLKFPQLTDEAWTFSVRIDQDEKIKASRALVTWKSDPINIAGAFPVIPTAKGSVSFPAFNRGPCMFTEGACLAVVQIVDQPDGGAKILILPTALWSDFKNDKRDPFVAVIEGTCTKDDAQ